mgnify:CR=1 FL=1
MVEKSLFKKALRFELWFAIILIAVLFVVFLRSFGGLVDQTESYKAEQVRDSFKSALRVLHTAWLTAGSPQLVSDFEGYGDGNLNLNDEGWPVAVTGVSYSSDVTEAGCKEVFFALLQDLYTAPGEAGKTDQQQDSAVTSSRLSVNVLAFDTVCVYQIGDQQQDSFSILYNAASGEVRMTRHQRS